MSLCFRSLAGVILDICCGEILPLLPSSILVIINGLNDKNFLLIKIHGIAPTLSCHDKSMKFIRLNGENLNFKIWWLNRGMEVVKKYKISTQYP